ncbi:MAG: ornithine carbamoyltransferase [Rhodospirillaceae bacterium]|nr:ornithine carbamoyltransferase [Rhodospirillaceae bacterium]|tara:strand:+ start:520 stop:1449 length:930 start_codon:yes stop_codon:yes gene_type:complete
MPGFGAVTEARSFLDLDAIDAATLRGILDKATDLRSAWAQGVRERPLTDKTVALIFEKPSTRTRISFDVAVRQLGGESIVVSAQDMQLGRGETVADTAKVLSRYVDAIAIRALKHGTLTELAAEATVPVINGLTDRSHPCQVMADIMTYEQYKGPIKDAVIAWSGDGNNVAASWIHAAQRFGFTFRIACPETLRPDADLVRWAESAGGKIVVTDSVADAVNGADCVVTDTWVSMGNNDAAVRRKLLKPYQVNADIMAMAKKDAIFMHCLPASRDEEVTAEVIDGPQSVVWDEAENRLHAQKGILYWCLS